MNNAEFIQDYLDGLLPPEQESQLFSELSSNEALRAELRQEIAMREAIRGDVAAYSPSVGSTLNIFSSLGFAPPPAAVIAPIPVAKPFITGLLTNFKQGIISVLSTAFVGVLVYFSVLQPADNNSNNANMANGSDAAGRAGLVASEQSGVPVSSSRAIDGKSAEPVKIVTKTVYKPYYVYVEDTTGNSPSLEDAKANAERNTAAIAERLNNPLASEYRIGRANVLINDLHDDLRISAPRNSFAMHNSIAPLGAMDFNMPVTKSEPLGLQIEWNGSAMWNNPEATTDPSSYAKFNNNSLTVFYALSDNWLVGAGIRQETFFQEFEGKDESGALYRYEQQPNLSSYNFAVRYRTNPYLGYFSLLGQATFGLNQAGPVARGMVGSEVAISPSFSLVAGLEFSSLFYKHQSARFNTSKYGFVYGLSFKF